MVSLRFVLPKISSDLFLVASYFGKVLVITNTNLFDCILYWGRAFVNRVPRMLDADYTPLSALDNLLKDFVRFLDLNLCQDNFLKVCACRGNTE